MYSRLILLASLLFVLPSAFSQSRKYVIAVIGSSTAQGVGANPIDSSWVNRTKSYYRGLGRIDTIYNIALGGQTTYAGMPSGFVPPAGRPTPDPATNITKALSFNPDVVLVNFPSNDAAADYSLAETMANLRTIYQAVVAAGKIAFITTSEPRTSLETSQKELLKTMRDSVEAEFGANSLDFYDAIVGPDSLDISPAYNFDGTHVNNAGHRQLFEVVRKANILPGVASPVLTLVDFTARPEGDVVLLGWALTGASSPVTVITQRSIDGTNFGDIGHQITGTGPGIDSSSWADEQPVPGESYYRLQYAEDTHWVFSPVVPVNLPPPGWGIGKLATTAGAQELQAEIFTPVACTATASVYNTAGELMLRQSLKLNPPSGIVPIPTAGWVAGEYILRVVTNLGNRATRAFMKF